MNILLEHIEHHLGRIEEGWTADADGKELPFQVIRTTGGLIANTSTYLTLGLSNTPLRSPCSNKLIRQEFVIVVRNSTMVQGVPSILQQVACEALSLSRPLLRGEVIGPRNAVFAGSKLNALYAAIPVYFADSFGSCEVDGLGSVIFSWLIPVSSDEVDFVKRCGWERFEDRLVEEDPDLIDVFREPMRMGESEKPGRLG